MRLIALKSLYRVNQGDRFEVSESVGRLAVLLGWARADDDEKPEIPVRRQTYRRRDLRAED